MKPGFPLILVWEGRVWAPVSIIWERVLGQPCPCMALWPRASHLASLSFSFSWNSVKIEVKEWFKDLHSVYYESIYRLQSSQSIFVGNLFLLLHSFNKYLRVWYSSQQTFSKKGQMVKFKLCGVHMVPVTCSSMWFFFNLFLNNPLKV